MWTVVFWLATLFVAVNQLWAGVTDVLHAQPLFRIALHLGYPRYFSTMLGIWKLLAASVALTARLTRICSTCAGSNVLAADRVQLDVLVSASD
jgi:hypothetical protein